MSRHRSNPYVEPKGKAGTFRRLFRLFFLFLALGTCGIAALALYAYWQVGQQGSRIVIEGGSPHLNPAERAYLQLYLSLRAEQLEQPVANGHQPARFVISSGETANQIAANLAADDLLTDTALFLNYLRFYGLDASLTAGTYEIDPQLTTPELAAILTRVIPQEIELRFLDGWRVEEMAHYLDTVRPANIRASDFLAIGQQQAPFALDQYDFLSALPAGATLEGFFFPDSYRVPIDADAAYLVNLMLSNFGRRLTPAIRQAYGLNGLSLYEAVTLASIVEREATLPAERPLMASVFLNRLALDMHLQADPTVQYAVGYDADSGKWWKSPLFQTDLIFESPYNTYLYKGLPPGPIANPGLASLQAVAEPADTDYLFFVSDCLNVASGAHLFSVTYEEHLANVQHCRQEQ